MPGTYHSVKEKNEGRKGNGRSFIFILFALINCSFQNNFPHSNVGGIKGDPLKVTGATTAATVPLTTDIKPSYLRHSARHLGGESSRFNPHA